MILCKFKLHAKFSLSLSFQSSATREFVIKILRENPLIHLPLLSLNTIHALRVPKINPSVFSLTNFGGGNVHPTSFQT
jgi:hypothetical protein